MKAARAAATEEEFEKALQSLGKAGEKLKNGDSMASKLAAALRRERKAGEVATALSHATDAELAELRAVGTTEKSLGDAGLVREAEAADSGIKITRSGIWICHSPCDLLEQRYARALAQEAKLGEELTEAKKWAKLATDNPENKEFAHEAGRRARALEAKLKRVLTPDRVAQIEKLKGLAKGGLAEFDPEQLERILAFRPDVNKMKGQMLEEMLNQRMLDPAERAAQAGKRAVAAAQKAGSELEFIPGYKIRGDKGRLLTDGILGYREGNKFRVVKVFEAKAGESSAEKLLEEGGRMSYGDWRELAEEATDDLRTEILSGHLDVKERAAIERMSGTDLRKAYRTRYREISKGLLQDEAGQARRTLERLAPGESRKTTTIYVDHEPMWVTAGPVQTRVSGYLPSNVDTTAMAKGIGEQGIKFDALKATLNQDELLALSQELKDSAAAAGIQ